MSSKLSLEEIQNECSLLLEKFDYFCSANNISYYLAYGSLLGAIRHGGPIPWDDDVDVLVPRPDFDRLLNLWDANSVNLKLFRPGDEHFPVYFAKLVSTRTRFIDNETEFPRDLGIFLDIFPIDGLPKKFPRLFRHFVVTVHRLLMFRFRRIATNPSAFSKSWLRSIAIRVLRLIPCSLYFQVLERSVRRYPLNRAQKVSCLLNYLPFEKDVMDRKDLEGNRKVRYGQLTLRTFASPETVLRRNYGGDWRTPIKFAGPHGTAFWKNPSLRSNNYRKS